jgi:putative component of membrane protein insertase Oxa1/YidC/SpoIIIJ protein YidD
VGLLLTWLLSTPLALLAISGYQQFVSPHKGWHCAFAALHRGASCSAYGKDAIARRGVIAGVSLLWERFDQCRAAAVMLAASSSGKGCDCCGLQGAADLAEKAAKKAANKAIDDTAQKAKDAINKESDKIGDPTLAFPLSGTLGDRKRERERLGYYHFGSNSKWGGGSKKHLGADWPAKPEEKVFAAEYGAVLEVGPVSEQYAWGQKIVIQHPRLGITTAYHHVDPAKGIRKGLFVIVGQEIGTVIEIREPPEIKGANHLHFEIRQGTTPEQHQGVIDPDKFPEKFLDPEKDVQYAAPGDYFRGKLP